MKKFLIVLVMVPVIIIVGFWGLSKYKNRRLMPDYFETHYKTQDTVSVGKVGIFVPGLVVPETYEEKGREFFYNITFKIYDNIIPWPFRVFAYMDKGVALLDPVRFHEHDEFTPTQLVDETGSDMDKDGVSYIDKYKNGEVEWVPPSKRIHLDHGYFRYTGRKAGYPSMTDKTLVKSRVWYYGKGIKQKKLPHWEGTFDVIDAAFNKIKEKYKDVEVRAECSVLYDDMKTKLWEMLDAGCDTIVLGASMPIYSHFEEFNSSFYHSIEYIEEWEHAHPGKKIKVIMAKPMGEFKPMRQAFLEMLKDRLDTLPEGSDVKVAVTVHGMPWDHFPWESWLELAPAYRDVLHEEVKALLRNYKFGRADTVVCQDEFAGPVWDKENKYLSTNEAYWDAINDGYDYVIGLPIEFWAENSDTLFHHALKNFHGFDEYDVYEQIDYPDWSVPYTQIMTQGKTKVIYNGVPVGKYQHYVIDALYQSIDSILAQSKIAAN
jgi:protoheme ferro-lyase